MKKVLEKDPQKLSDRKLKKALKEAREKIPFVRSEEQAKQLADQIDILLEEAERRFMSFPIHHPSTFI